MQKFTTGILFLLIGILSSCQQTNPTVNTDGNTTSKEINLNVSIPMYEEPITITAQVVDDLLVWGGDMVVGNVSELDTSAFGTNKINYASRIWPGNTVFYTIRNDMSNEKRTAIAEAIAHWEEKTNVKFVARTNQTAYVEFFPAPVDNDSCWSNLGFTGGKQSISVASWCGRGSLIHEVGHTMGLMHEQMRPDRDDYVEILWDNIPSNWHSQYEKITSDSFANLSDYDYDSIMHYPAYFGGQLAISPKNGVSPSRLGQHNGLSSKDISGIDQLYPPLGAPARAKTISPGSSSSADGGQIIGTVRPQLMWRVTDGAAWYQIKIFKENRRTYRKSKLTGTSFTIPSGKLVDGSTYKWRSRACNSIGCGRWSRSRHFKIDVNLGPEQPSELTITPTSQPNVYKVEWSEAARADKYWLYYNSTNNYSSAYLLSDSLTSTSIVIDLSSWGADQLCMWVRAANDFGVSTQRGPVCISGLASDVASDSNNSLEAPLYWEGQP